MLITFLRYIYVIFLRQKVIGKSENSGNQGFSSCFCWTNESGWPKNIRIRIHNTGNGPTCSEWLGHGTPCPTFPHRRSWNASTGDLKKQRHYISIRYNYSSVSKTWNNHHLQSDHFSHSGIKNKNKKKKSSVAVALKGTVYWKLRWAETSINRSILINCLAGKYPFPDINGHNHDRSMFSASCFEFDPTLFSLDITLKADLGPSSPLWDLVRIRILHLLNPKPEEAI